MIEAPHSAEWKELQVSILHEIILGPTLNTHDNVSYIKNLQKGMTAVNNGEFEAIFLLKATNLESIQKITELGEIMPHKSTYFHPKPLSGLLIFRK